MRRILASLLAVWATLGIVAVLVWTRPAPSPPPQAAPTTFVVKGKNGVPQLVVAAPAVTHGTTHVSPVGGG
jgi:hypothetical protein